MSPWNCNWCCNDEFNNDTTNIVTSLHNLSEHLELSLGVEGHEVHASVPAKVTPVKPIPVLERNITLSSLLSLSRNVNVAAYLLVSVGPSRPGQHPARPGPGHRPGLGGSVTIRR